MLFTTALVVPPFSIGGEIYKTLQYFCKKIICIMPIECYRKYSLFKRIKKIKYINESLYSEALLAPTICLTINSKKLNKKFLLNFYNLAWKEWIKRKSMYLSNKTKKKIKKEFDSWVNLQYAGLSLEEREKFEQHFTPPLLLYKC